MSKLAFYGSPLSQPTRFVMWTAKILGLNIPLTKVDAGLGQHREPDFLKMNPNAQFPVLQDGDLIIYESNAIARYLCNKFSQPAAETLYPTDPATRALVEQWMEWKHQDLRNGCAGIVRRRVMKNLMKDISKHSMSVVFKEIPEEREARQLLQALSVLEAQLGATQKFLVPSTNQPTLADLSVFEEIDQLKLLPQTELPPFGGKLETKFPNVVAWAARVRAFQPETYAATHAELNGASAKLEKGRRAKL